MWTVRDHVFLNGYQGGGTTSWARTRDLLIHNQAL